MLCRFWYDYLQHHIVAEHRWWQVLKPLDKRCEIFVTATRDYAGDKNLVRKALIIVVKLCNASSKVNGDVEEWIKQQSRWKIPPFPSGQKGGSLNVTLTLS